ncbi:hypothetical protein DFJ73DRAFT_756204 [Zopfochytrium polystomum]|nr:hypothetical protein DFJ73DRAFT_756204 [Zopfochytrium polystomum]
MAVVRPFSDHDAALMVPQGLDVVHGGWRAQVERVVNKPRDHCVEWPVWLYVQFPRQNQPPATAAASAARAAWASATPWATATATAQCASGAQPLAVREFAAFKPALPVAEDWNETLDTRAPLEAVKNNVLFHGRGSEPGALGSALAASHTNGVTLTGAILLPQATTRCPWLPGAAGVPRDAEIGRPARVLGAFADAQARGGRRAQVVYAAPRRRDAPAPHDEGKGPAGQSPRLLSLVTNVNLSNLGFAESHRLPASLAAAAAAAGGGGSRSKEQMMGAKTTTVKLESLTF